MTYIVSSGALNSTHSLGEWLEEIFEIASQLPTVPVTYELVYLAGETITGKFYEQEIQKVTKYDYERFEIDRILQTRKRNCKIQYFVARKAIRASSIFGWMNWCRNESILRDAPVQQLDGLLSE